MINQWENVDAYLKREDEDVTVECRGIYNRCTLLDSTRNNGELGFKPTWKLALLELVETKESFSTDIMRYRLLEA